MHAVEYRNSSVQHSQRSFYLSSEIDMSGSIDQIELVVSPSERDRCGSNSNTSFSLLLHIVHHGVSIVDLC